MDTVDKVFSFVCVCVFGVEELNISKDKIFCMLAKNEAKPQALEKSTLAYMTVQLVLRQEIQEGQSINIWKMVDTYNMTYYQAAPHPSPQPPKNSSGHKKKKKN